MPTFSAELDKACARAAREAGRDLAADEITRIEGQLFEDWIAAGRQDELIRTVLARYGRDGGLVDIITLGQHLRETRDGARIHALFGQLLSRRVKAFFEWWPQAADGHLGCMQASARAAAAAMDVFIEYFHSRHALGLDAGCDAVREAMLRLQSRRPQKDVLSAIRRISAIDAPR
jgi:hypothetical protein